MATSPITHFVFVDFENVRIVDLDLITTKTTRVYLVVGAQQKRVDYALLEGVHRLGSQVERIKVNTTGSNVLDLTLASHLCLTAANNLDGQFFIVAKDTGYNSLIVHLKKQGIRASRHNSFSELPFLSARAEKAPPKPRLEERPEMPAKPSAGRPPAPARKKNPVDKYAKLLEQFRRGNHRPKSRAKLMHHIHALYGQKSSLADQSAVVHRLLGEKIISIDEKDKVTYLQGSG